MTYPFCFKVTEGIVLECAIEYEPGEPDYTDCPGYPSSAYVEKATINGEDFTDLLREEVLDQISEAFLKEFENQAGQYEPDYASMLDN